MRDKSPHYKINNNKLAKNVSKAQNGDKKALEYIVNETGNYVYYYCLSLLCDEEKAKDAVQDIYVKILTNLRSVKNPKAFLAWLKTVTANHCKNLLLKKREEEELTDTFEESDIQVIPEKCIETEEVCEIIRNSIKELPEIQRECVLMYYYQQLSIKEISEVLEVKEGTVKSRLYTARMAIKRELEKYGKANLLGGAAPLSYITYTLIGDAEKSKIFITPKSVFALRTQLESGLVTVSEVAATSFKYTALVKSVAVATAFVVAAGGATYIATRNAAANDTEVETTVIESTEYIPKFDALEMYYASGFGEDEKRQAVSFNPDKSLNSKSNKQYIIDRIYNSLDYFNTIQSTFYYYDRNINLEETEYVTYCADTKNRIAKEIILDSNGAPFLYTFFTDESHFSCGFGDRKDIKKNKGDKKIFDKAIKQRKKRMLEKLYDDEFVDMNNYGRWHEEIDFVKLIEPEKRFNIEDGDYLQYFRYDTFHLYTSNYQYKPEVFACNHKMTDMDNWTVEKIVYKFGRECFVINGTSNGFNRIYSYKALVDKENGVFVSLDAYDNNGELIRRIEPYEYKINEEIDKTIFDENTDKLTMLPYGGLNDQNRDN